MYCITESDISESPLAVDAVVVDPVSDRRNADAALEDVALVRVPGQHRGGDEASVGPAPDGDPGLVNEGIERDELLGDVYLVLHLHLPDVVVDLVQHVVACGNSLVLIVAIFCY